LHAKRLRPAAAQSVGKTSGRDATKTSALRRS
jgi:hypothetical protein